MPIESIEAFRHAVRRNQDFSDSDKVFVGQEGEASQVQVKAESLGHRIIRHIHQSDDEKRAIRQAREVFWKAVSSAYSRRNMAIPEHVLRALAEDGVPVTDETFQNVNKPLSARVVQKVLAAMDFDLNLIAAAQKEVSVLQEGVRRQMFELDLLTARRGFPPADLGQVADGDEREIIISRQRDFCDLFKATRISARDYARLRDTGMLEAKREQLQARLAELSKFVAEGKYEYLSARDKFQELLDMLEDFELAGKEYEAKRACIYEPLLRATCEYQGLCHAYNNVIFSDAQKQQVRPFGPNPKETHLVLCAKRDLVMDSSWKKRLLLGRPMVSTKGLRALKVEQRSVFLYTLGSNHVNAPLAGYAGGSYDGQCLGVNKTSWDVTLSDNSMRWLSHDSDDMDVGNAREHIAGMTREVDKHFNDEDFVVLRGTRTDQLASMLHVSEDTLRKLPIGDHPEMCLKQGYFPAFTSTSHSAKACQIFMQPQGEGENLKAGVSMRIFCPKGTKMLYITPSSYYNDEYELVLQRGAHFRVSKFSRVSEKRFEVELEIHPELGYTMVTEGDGNGI